MKNTHVTLLYFKKTGKYYSEGELALPYTDTGDDCGPRPVQFHEALDHVAAMLNRGERPGLINGMDFDVLVTVYTEYGPLSHMFVRDIDGYIGQRSLRVNA